MNNRIIKFRVWDIRNNKWFDSHKRCCHIEYTTENFVASKNFIFQQFTGLTDNNKKEIFEGDILKVKGHNSWFDNIGYYYNMEIKYETRDGFGDCECAGFFYLPKDREVVGNIYENPELLNPSNS